MCAPVRSTLTEHRDCWRMMTVGVKRYHYAEVLCCSAFSASGIHVIGLPDERMMTVCVKRFRYAEGLFPSAFSATKLRVDQATGDTGLRVKCFRCPEVLFQLRSLSAPNAGSEGLEGMQLVKHQA